MADIFSVIEGLTVDKDDILEAETFAEQYLSAAFPTYDFRQGTALRDMTVRPNATLIALVNKAIKYYLDGTDILDITNDTDESIADQRFSNFFLTRKEGDKAEILARLYFTFPVDSPINTLVPVNAFFSTDNTIKFYPKSNTTIFAPVANEVEGEIYFKKDQSNDQWYADIILESSGTGDEFNIETGDLLYFTIFSPYFIRADIQYLETRAIDKETNEEMGDRAYSAVSTRNLINTPSIISRLTDKFNYVKQVYPVGLGNDWLYRDLISIADGNELITFHKGGHVDVYTETIPDKIVVQLVAEEDRDNSDLVAFYIKGPLYGATRVQVPPAGSEDDTVPYFLNPAMPELGTQPFTYEAVNVTQYDSGSIPVVAVDDIGLSPDQLFKIQFVSAYNIGDTASFSLDYFSGITSIDTSINSVEESVVCADYLTRAFQPIFIDITVDIRQSFIDGEIPAEPLEELRKYIDNIKHGGALYVSELVSILIDNGITDFKMPLSVKSVEYSRKSTGTQDGSTSYVETDVVDSRESLPIQKFYMRNLEYVEEPSND